MPKNVEIPEAQPEHISGMFSDYWLDYSSYVILERAVPHLDDGLKPVQRRILHALREMDDGRYNKVANVVGQTMAYHPHGDASIGDAMIQLGQKDLLIDPQGNWGNIITGDGAAAPRYIEARLTPFAKEVVFNPKTTEWQLSYDGRKKEPVTLPVKFPLLLAQGVEGIAVGLACRILPHNFNELIDASIEALRGKKVEIYPDFPTGGIADVSNYQDGLQGGRVRCRARIESVSARILRIYEIPFGTTTSSLIDSIVSANEKGKLKVAKIDDNTAAEVEILVHLPSGTDPQQMIQSLYAFTDCEVSLSPNSCVIDDQRPAFYGASDILRKDAELTKELLRRELEIRQGELEDKWHFCSLERIFIENRIYHRIEGCTSIEAAVEEIRKGLKPHLKKLKRPVTEEDILKLLEVRMKRITKYDSNRAEEELVALEKELAEVLKNLKQLTRYAIAYFKHLKKTYGKGRERKTELAEFERVEASKVVLSNETLYINAKDGFIGWGLKKDGEAIGKCSKIDDIIVFRRDGVMMVSKIDEKKFVGKDIIHAAIFQRDEKKVYNLVYRDGRGGPAFAKRFEAGGVTRDKEYPLTKGKAGSRVLFFEVLDADAEPKPVTIHLKEDCSARKKQFYFSLAELDIKTRGVGGITVTKHPVAKVNRGKI